MQTRFWAVLAILALNILGAIFLETKMTALFAAELAIILIAIILSAIVLIGIATETKWAWPVATLFFALSLANLVFLLLATRAFGTFAFLLLVNVVGLLVSVLSIKEADEFEEPVPLETYSPETEQEVVYEGAPRAKKQGARKKKKK